MIADAADHFAIDEGLRAIIPKVLEDKKIDLRKVPKDEYGSLISELQNQMAEAAAKLDFEKAAELRDVIGEIQSKL
jgi:excinuclease ABC subunit B